MLCTFTTEIGSLVVSSEDIKAIEDKISDAATCILAWMTGDVLQTRNVKGTARENRDRIQQEELDLIARVEAHRYETQRRLSEGYPVPPIARGKAVR